MNESQLNKFLQDIGKILANARKEKGYSQEDLAELTGIDRVAIGYIEQGRRKPTMTTVYKIALALNVKLSKLFKNY